MPPTQTINEQEILKSLGLDGQFKSLTELKKFTADAQSAIKERDGYKSRFSTYGKTATEAGYKSLDEVFKAAAEAKKKAAGGNGSGDFRTEMSDLYLKTYGTEEHGRLMKEDPRMFEFWASVIQKALSGIPTDKFLTQDKLDELREAVASQFEERDFYSGLDGEEAKLARQFKNDIRRLYADEQLFNVPVGADDNYNGFSEAWNRHKKNFEKAGMKMSSERTRETPDEPARRIAFPGNAIPSSAADGQNRPGPGFDEKAFLRDNPELIDPETGQFDWAGGFALGKEE